jgi:MiaB/RimO family radical SAM methylthiotransferase
VLDRWSQQQKTQPSEGTGSVLGRAQSYGELLSRHPMDREWAAPSDAFQVPLRTDENTQGDPEWKQHTEKTRAFLKIQEGCNSFCTYCIIPYGRGPSRSLRPREILDQVKTLVAQGVREVVVTGTNIGDYGTDWGGAPALEELFELILKESTLERLRTSSLDPTEITPGLLKLVAENPRICPHFHVSLQSPHSRILRLMKRKYGFEQVKECLERIAELPASVGGAFVGMDVITGFPGETLEEFEWGVEALRQLPWTRLHVFPFSEREGTPATRLTGSVPQAERVRRARVLNALSLERMKSHYLKILETPNVRIDSVLFERGVVRLKSPSDPQSDLREMRAGYTPHYLRVLVPVDRVAGNQDGSVRPHDLWVDEASGEVALLGELS